MRRLISLSLALVLLLAAAPIALGLLKGLPWGHGEAASSSLTCSVKPLCDTGEVAVFRMSGLANAHAGTAGSSAYGYTVCCGGPAGLAASCTGYYDTVLTLSATDNAHAASDGSYGTQVCLSAPYTVMDCQYGSSCGTGYTCLATISGTTNAHVADCDGSGDYATKVCCVANPDTDGDGIPDYLDPDADNDGCANSEELAMGLDPLKWYDFYDVPVPANPDMTPNGPKNKAVTMGDVLAVLRYVGTHDGDGGVPNPNGVAYDTVKGSCVVLSVQQKEGLCYDRSPSPLPNPPWDAGPPSGAVNMADVLAVLAQVGLSCAGP